ncbi:olfactory receptor 14A16-like [Columba livia]|uniref:olfactory receptor 14A16-like n=1 Tax=Columba livia TaxID=8932 RepID=UPI0031BB744B
MSNSSSITQFLLLAFTDTQELRLLHFWLFLGIYLAALLGNGLIITTIAWDQHLHTPMYFFLLKLSLLDLGSISTILPKSLDNSLWDTRAISFLACAVQVFIFLLFIAAEEAGLIVVSVCLGFGCFVFTVLSYVQIFRAVLRIPSEQGRHKAFSTCLPHLAVVSLFICTGVFAHLKPPSISSPSLDLLMSVLYLVVPPVVNPLIYSMRNQELKDALRKLMTGLFSKAII